MNPDIRRDRSMLYWLFIALVVAWPFLTIAAVEALGYASATWSKPARNAVIAGAIIAPVVAAIASVWARKRFARGLCQHCGYDAGRHVTRCPECGEARA
jgi:hypothetical protein